MSVRGLFDESGKIIKGVFSNKNTYANSDETLWRLDKVAEDIFDGGKYKLGKGTTKDWTPYILENTEKGYRGVLEFYDGTLQPLIFRVRKVGSITPKGKEPIFDIRDWKNSRKKGTYVYANDVTTGGRILEPKLCHSTEEIIEYLTKELSRPFYVYSTKSPEERSKDFLEKFNSK